MDCQELLCNKCVKEWCACEKVTKCHDCLIMDIDYFKEVGFEWKCNECACYAVQHCKESEECDEY
eukprot:13154841-Ditylum_brightwellii.AAC.1